MILIQELRKILILVKEFGKMSENDEVVYSKNPINPLTAFLNQYKTKEKDFTHTWLGYPKASYNVPDDKMTELFKLLHQRMFVDKKEAHLTEKPCQPANIKIDLDFRYIMDLDDRQHTPEIIQEIVQLYNQVITEYLEVDEGQLKAYVFERPCGYKFKGYTRDGVHIMYPEIVAPVEAQHAIRKRVLELIDPIVNKLPLVNTKDDVVDKSVISDNNWLAYGCTKPALPAYRITAIYDHQLEKLPISNDHLKNLINLSNFNPNRLDFQVKAREEKQAEIDYLNQHRHTKPIKAQNNLAKEQRNHLNETHGTSLDELRLLVKMLKPYRAESYMEWIQVGWCLHNIDHGLLQEWIDFSRLSAKYQEGECQRLWADFRDEGYHVGSLHRWARQDSPGDYDLHRRERLKTYVEKSITGTTFDVATVVHQMFRYDYVCASYKHNVWYEFRNHRWREIDQGVALKRHLSNEVLNEFLRLISFYNQSALGEKDEFKDQFMVKAKQMTDVSYKLRDWTFKEKVMSECRGLFYDMSFCNKLDTNPDLIGFENGVYNLKSAEFRNGRPEDYVSMSTKIDYIEYVPDDPEIVDIYKYLSQVFPIERVRDYVITLLGSFLLGSNPDEKFHIWTGSGANSKSKMIELYENAFGEYTSKLPVSLLTQKRAASNSASPELAKTKGVRFISLQEPDENERFNIGLLKELTGGDKIQTRPMYRDPIEFKPQFKMILCCNHLPKLPPNDDGTWRRVRVVDFVARFVDEPDPNDPHQFKKDPYLANKFPGWKNAFMYILLQHYQVYRVNGIVEPPEVKEATKEYQRMSDIYVEFRDEYMEPDQHSSVKLEECYAKFKNWYRASYDGKVPSRKDFKNSIEKHLKVKYNMRHGWVGWNFTMEVDELDVDEFGPTENPTPQITPKAFKNQTPGPKHSLSTPHLQMRTPHNKPSGVGHPGHGGQVGNPGNLGIAQGAQGTNGAQSIPNTPNPAQVNGTPDTSNSLPQTPKFYVPSPKLRTPNSKLKTPQLKLKKV